MKNILFILSFIPALLFGQINYNITVSSTNAWFGNLFFQQGGNPPGWTGPGPSPKPVKILDVNGVEIFSENWQKKVGILKLMKIIKYLIMIESQRDGLLWIHFKMKLILYIVLMDI